MSFELVGVKLVAQDYSQYMTQVGNADKATSGFGDTSKGVFQQMPGLADIAVGAFHKIGAIAVEVFAEAGKAAVGFIKDSIGVAGDFESGMNRFGAVAGDALTEAGLSLKDFRDQFIQIGKELPVSTADVQDAAIEMVKGGIEPATIAAGGLKQVIQFAAAADLDLAEASTIAAKAIGGWVAQTATAQEKAEFLAHSTDLLSKAANASTVNVDDLALGLYNVQGTAKLAGVSFDETVTALAQLAPSFSSSADAGTSFKTFLSRLQPQTKAQAEAMQALGLYTMDTGSVFYDAQGNFVGMAEAQRLLHDATADLSEAQRVQILQTIFGQDAIRTAAVFSEQGADGYNAMTAALEKQNSVADMAKQKQAGFNTALDNFKGSVEALQITIGSLLLPVLTTLFNNYLAPGVNTLTDLAGAVSGDADAFARLSPTLQSAVTFMGNLSTTANNALAAFGESGLGAAITGFATTVQTAFAEGGITAAIQVVIDTLAEVSPMFALIRGGAEAAFPAVQQIVTDTFGIIETVIQEHGDQMVSDVQSIWDRIWESVNTVLVPLQELVATVFGIVADTIHENGDDTTSFIKETWDSVFEIIDTALQLISGIVAGVLIIVNEIIKEHGDLIKTIITNVWTIIKNIIGGALDIIKGLLTAALKIFQGDWEGAWTAIREMSESVVKRLWEIIKAGLDLIANLFGTTLTGIAETWSHNWETFKSGVKTGIDNLVGFFTGIPSTVAGVGAAIVDSIWEGLKSRWDAFVADLQRKLEELRNMLPFSEPKDPSSPLRGLQQSGYAMVEQIQIGIDSFGPLRLPEVQTRGGGSLGDLLGSSGAWGNSGGGSSSWGQGIVAGIASPALAAARGVTSATYNQQRSVALTYNTPSAPPVSQSYAMAQALIGAF